MQSPRNQAALRSHLAASDSPQTQAGATLLPEQIRAAQPTYAPQPAYGSETASVPRAAEFSGEDVLESQ